MLKVFEEAVRQALRFFSGPATRKELVKGAEEVAKAAAKIAAKGK